VALAVILLRQGESRQDRGREAEQMRQQLSLALSQQAETVQRVERSLREQEQALSKAVAERLDRTEKATGQIVTDLRERLVRIDEAQKKIGDLSTQVVSLQEVLSNKQARGAFGQARMEAIVQDGLPKGAFAFQHTLKSGKRPDCAVFLPDGRPLVIDAKFPLEAVTAFRDAATDDERSRAAQRLRQDIARHVADIAEKYLVPGETQDTALMFVPSESVYAELHDGFDDIVQKAYRARVVLVSPALLMLAIQVIQQIQKDARMREAADRIRSEVGAMLDDLGRLRERVVRLERHFGQANEDIRQILISSDKIDKRATRIEELEFDGEDVPSDPVVIPAPMARKLQAGE
jgi:DNA recombination protein RmuC